MTTSRKRAVVAPPAPACRWVDWPTRVRVTRHWAGNRAVTSTAAECSCGFRTRYARSLATLRKYQRAHALDGQLHLEVTDAT